MVWLMAATAAGGDRSGRGSVCRHPTGTGSAQTNGPDLENERAGPKRDRRITRRRWGALMSAGTTHASNSSTVSEAQLGGLTQRQAMMRVLRDLRGLVVADVAVQGRPCARLMSRLRLVVDDVRANAYRRRASVAQQADGLRTFTP